MITERATRAQEPQRRWPVERGESVPHRTPARNDVFGVAAVLSLALAYLSPAFVDGASFGTYDLVLRATSLGRAAFPHTPFNHVASDSVSEMAAWNQFDWSALRSGHFPLWNGLSLFGLPQFLNFQSGVLSLPNLVSYAVPLRVAYTVSVGLVLVIAGTGAYFLARVLGLRPLGASFAGIAFMLSGPFANWIWDPISSVVSLLGWILAFAILCYRGSHRLLAVTGLALSTAFCLYGGFPEAVVFVAASVAIIAVSSAAASGIRRLFGRGESGPGPGWGGLARITGGGLAGVLLALPLWWPGLQLLSSAHRETRTGFPAFPGRALALFVAQGYDGLQSGRNPWFLPGWNYYESVSYVGVVVLVLAAVACLRWWRHPTVIALTVLPICVLAVLYSKGPLSFVHHLLTLVSSQTYWPRFRVVIGLPLGLLAGLGLETVARRGRERPTAAALCLATVVLAGVVAAMWALPASGPDHLVRERSLFWPTGLVAACGLVALLALAGGTRTGTGGTHRARGGGAGRPLMLWAAFVLWGGNAAFLLFAGVGTNAYSQSFYPVTGAIAALSSDIGSTLVGLDGGNGEKVGQLVDAGIYPEANLPYEVAEFAAHDPILPQSYFVAFAGGEKRGPGFFEPDITSARQARSLGIAYVLAAPSRPPLPGGVRVGVLAGETLYRVPGATRFSVSTGEVTGVTGRDGSYTVAVSARRPTVLTARVTSVPGWHATVNGKTVALERDGVFYEIGLPAGRDEVRLSYLPARLVQGVIAACVGAGGLLLYALVLLVTGGGGAARRRKHLPGRGGPSLADLLDAERAR